MGVHGGGDGPSVHDGGQHVHGAAVGRDDGDGDDDRNAVAAVVHDDDDGDGVAAVVRGGHGVHGDDDGVPSAGPNGCQRDDRRDVVAALLNYNFLVILLTGALNSSSGAIVLCHSWHQLPIYT